MVVAVDEARQHDVVRVALDGGARRQLLHLVERAGGLYHAVLGQDGALVDHDGGMAVRHAGDTRQ